MILSEDERSRREVFTYDSQLGELGQCVEIREAMFWAKYTGESAVRCNAVFGFVVAA